MGEVPREEPNFAGDLSRTPGEWAGEYEINGGNLKLIDNTAEGFQSKNYNLQVKTGKFIIQYGTGTFITKWNVNSDEDIKLPIPKNVNNSYIVDWGDNTYNRYTDEAFPTHRYADNSERTIAIAGIMKEFGHCQDAIPNSTNMYSDYFSQTEHIIEIIQWGVVGATKYGFAHCGNLTGNIPSPASESFKELTSGTFMFKDCSNLRGSIPAEFFKDAGNAEEFKTTFAGCTGLTGEIPGNLFNGCIKAGTFSETFNGCTGLTGTIPEGLFSSCLGAKNFNATFAGCTGLNGAIPENLFGSCTKVQEFNSTFAGCTGLNGAIPEGLFSSCTNANVFRETFANCSNLTSDAKGAVAQNLFANNKNANNFYRTFYGCTNLSGNLNIVLPSLNFDINKEITGNYTSMFEGCTGIEKVILSNIKIGYKMFKDCTGIKELVLSNTEAICGEAFSGCIYLTNINVNDDNLKEIIQGAFYIAGDIITKSIASVPDKLLTSINRESQTLMAYDWLTDNRLVDLDAPKGTVTISQYPFTSSHSLDITIAVVDNYSNEDKCKMAIVLGENYSESLNVESLTWQDYSSTSQIKLQNITEGIKTVWVFFKDEVGNISRIKKEI